MSARKEGSSALSVPIAEHTRDPSASAVFFHVNNDTAAPTSTAGSTDTNSAEGPTGKGLEMQSYLASPTATQREGLSSTSSLASVFNEPTAAKSCLERNEGFNRGLVWSSCLFIAGIILWVIPLIIPGVVMVLMKSQICDQLCIPVPAAGSAWTSNLNNPADWKINNFLTNANRSWWPQEYFNVYLYHVNNSAAVIAGKEPKLKVELVGPYVFTTYRYKYNVSFSEDFEQIRYNQAIQYTFQPSLSGGRSLSDKLTTVSLPFVSINWMEYVLANAPMGLIVESVCLYSDPVDSCLFQTGQNVQQTLFNTDNGLYDVANELLMSNNLAPTFQLFFNYSTNPSAAHVQNMQNSFGMGGNLHTFVGQILDATETAVLFVNLTAMPTANDSLLSSQYTGQGGSYSNLFGFSQYEGNTSINTWNGPETIAGTDHFQFAPPITPYSTLTVWDDDVLRQVNLQFKEKVKVLDSYDAYRFTPTDLFSGKDPHYGGKPGFEGLLPVNAVSQIHYGSQVSAYASRPFLAGVNSTLANSVICMNCPDVSNRANWLDTYLDVEPNIGKVLGGHKRGQINALIGQPEVYRNASFGSLLYQHLPLSLVPLVYFEYTQEVEFGDQTRQLDDGVDKVKLARTATATIFYLLLPLSVIAFTASFIVALRADESGACCTARTAVRTYTK